ncbi:MAG: hypothetical protein AABX40_06610 [Candidatus Hydrothermarchaeota archaeon]
MEKRFVLLGVVLALVLAGGVYAVGPQGQIWSTGADSSYMAGMGSGDMAAHMKDPAMRKHMGGDMGLTEEQVDKMIDGCTSMMEGMMGNTGKAASGMMGGGMM